ncbi:MAG: SEL1-like repeat protein [Planctomycetes bacterium]|nr:SEL1-like repeat protein [Planctomycetota bacterium]
MSSRKSLVLLVIFLALFATIETCDAPAKAQDETAKQRVDFEKAAAEGDAEAQYQLGLRALKDEGESKRNYRHALLWFFKAAKQGHGSAQFELGYSYLSGYRGLDQDYRKAVRWLARAAEQGHTQAWLELGTCHAQGGYGIFQDRAQALACFQKAEEKGGAEACHELGNVYRQGRGAIAPDWPKALAYYLKAAEKGHLEACNAAAECYEFGIGTAPDLIQAVGWYLKAAEKGCVEAQEKVALCYEQGVGVPKDLAKAKAWYAKADSAAKTGIQKSVLSFKRMRRTNAQAKPEPVTITEVKKPVFAEGVEVTLQTDKAEYETHDFIQVTITFKNNGKRTYSFTERHTEGSGHHFEAKDAEGRVLPYPYAVRKRHGPTHGGGMSSVRILRPGEQIERKQLLNRSVYFDTPGVYSITTRASVVEGMTGGWKNGAEYVECKVVPKQITLRAADKDRRAAAIESLVRAHGANAPLPEEFRAIAPSGSALALLMLYREPALMPFFMDILENATGRSADGAYYARIAINALPDQAAVLREFERCLEHPEKYNTPKLLWYYLQHTAPDEDWFGLQGWGPWKREQEITRKYRDKALRLLHEDKKCQYAYLVPDLLGGSEDAFLVDYLMRAKSDFNFVNGSYTLQRVKVAREHIPHLESLLETGKGWHIADAAILHLVNFDRRRYLPELSKHLDRFSAETRKLLETDANAEEDLPALDGQGPSRGDQHGDPLPPGALARLGTERLRVKTPVVAIAFARDGKTFVTAEHSGALCLWDAATGKELRQLRGSWYGVLSLAFCPDGKTLVTGDSHGTVSVWDIATGEVRRQFSGSSAGIYSIAVSEDGKRLASGNADSSVHLWDPASGELVCKLREPVKEYSAFGVAFSPDSRIVAVGAGTRVTLFDVKTGKELSSLGNDVLGEITALIFAPDGKRVYTGSTDGVLRQWDLSTGRELCRFVTSARHPIISAALTGDGRMLASADEVRSSIVLWDTVTGRRIRQVELPRGLPYAVAFSPDGKTFAAAGGGPAIALWDTATGEESCPSVGREAIIDTVAFAPDGRSLASSSDDGTIRFWEPSTGKLLRAIEGSSDKTSRLCFAANGKTLLGLGRTLRQWDVPTGKQLLGSREKQSPAFTKSALSADGSILATTSVDNQIWIRNTVSGRQYPMPETFGEFFALSGDGKLFAIADSNARVSWREVATGKEIGACQAIPSFDRPLKSAALALSADGRIVATTAGGDSVVRLWEAATGGERAAFGNEKKSLRAWRESGGAWTSGGPDTVHAFAFSPDCRMLALAQGTDKSDMPSGKYRSWQFHAVHAITIWDLVTGKQQTGRTCCRRPNADVLAGQCLARVRQPGYYGCRVGSPRCSEGKGGRERFAESQRTRRLVERFGGTGRCPGVSIHVEVDCRAGPDGAVPEGPDSAGPLDRCPTPCPAGCRLGQRPLHGPRASNPRPARSRRIGPSRLAEEIGREAVAGSATPDRTALARYRANLPLTAAPPNGEGSGSSRADRQYGSTRAVHEPSGRGTECMAHARGENVVGAASVRK